MKLNCIDLLYIYIFTILSLQDGVLLTKLITKYCPVDGINPNDLQVMKTNLSALLKSKEMFCNLSTMLCTKIILLSYHFSH